jgi:hypothetical protein
LKKLESIFKVGKVRYPVLESTGSLDALRFGPVKFPKVGIYLSIWQVGVYGDCECRFFTE